jgi:hypothetical protein
MSSLTWEDDNGRTNACLPGENPLAANSADIRSSFQNRAVLAQRPCTSPGILLLADTQPLLREGHHQVQRRSRMMTCLDSILGYLTVPVRPEIRMARESLCP